MHYKDHCLELGSDHKMVILSLFNTNCRRELEFQFNKKLQLIEDQRLDFFVKLSEFSLNAKG